MSTEITTTGVHHIRLIVTDPVRSRDFYTSLLNFKVAAELPPGFVLTNGNILLGVTPPWDASQAIPNDRFSPHRVGLDHLERDFALHVKLAGTIHRRHTALAKEGQYLVLPDALTDQVWHDDILATSQIYLSMGLRLKFNIMSGIR